MNGQKPPPALLQKKSNTLYPAITIFIMVVFSPAFLPAVASNIPVTGQTQSYTAADDGALEKGIAWPTPRFSDNNNGTITDTLTNLIWIKNADCYGSTTWLTALTNSLNLATGSCNLTDGSVAGTWRLPNIREIESLIHSGVFNPTVPNSVGSGKATSGDPFTSLPSNDYWSSTTNPQDPKDVLAVNCTYGHIVSKAKSNNISALFVRDNGSGTGAVQVFETGQTLCYTPSGGAVDCNGSGQDGDLQKGLAWPTPRFIDNGNGTVTDALTSLTWLKNANCQGLNNWVGAVSFAKNLAGGSCGLTDNSSVGDWRLPNRREMLSLMDYNYSSPALSDTQGSAQWSNDDPFISVQTTSYYWTSTTYAATTTQGIYVDMKNSSSGIYPKLSGAFAWPVRDEMMRQLSVSITGDGSGTVTSLPEGISCPGTCSAEFERFSGVTLTAQPDNTSRFEGWSIPGCGKNLQCTVTVDSTTTVTATFLHNQATISSWMILLTR